MTIFLATEWLKDQKISLMSLDANNRLMNFYHLSDKKAKRTLKEYMESEETYCDLCDRKRECQKSKDGLWVCIICKRLYYLIE